MRLYLQKTSVIFFPLKFMGYTAGKFYYILAEILNKRRLSLL